MEKGKTSFGNLIFYYYDKQLMCNIYAKPHHPFNTILYMWLRGDESLEKIYSGNEACPGSAIIPALGWHEVKRKA